MATEIKLGSNLTMMELRRREDPDGSMATLIDAIAEENHILEHMTWVQCNNGRYHEGTIVVTEPTGQERAEDEGVTKEAGVTEKEVEPTCELASISEVDKKTYDRSASPDAMRLSEDTLFLKGMTKTFVSRFFDGNRATDPRRIYGINQRAAYNTLTSDYVYDNSGGNASSTQNKTSVYFMQFGENKLNMIYPRGDSSSGGEMPVSMTDYGLQVISQSGTSDTKKYPAYQTWFDLSFGIFIHDPRCIKRICNISTSGIDGVDDVAWYEDPMIDAFNDLEYNGTGAVIICNRTVLAQAMKRANEKGNAFYTESAGEGPFAHPVTYWQGIPMVRCDQITNTQDTIE